jgi:hypothetical protein
MKLAGNKYAFLQRKIATLVLVSASLAAFATLGDGGKKEVPKNLLSVRVPATNYKNFTLRSGYHYRGNTVLGTEAESRYFVLDRVITYQKGNQTYILPMKKKVLLDKVTFTPRSH